MIMRPLMLFSLALFAAVTSAPAATIVTYGGNYVSTNKEFISYAAGNTQGGFSGGDPLQLSPLSSAPYSGPTFYGQVTWATDTGDPGGSIKNATFDQIEFKMDDSALDGLVLFRQADFGGGLNTGNIGFDATSTFDTNIGTFAAFDDGRAVIRIEGSVGNDGYYISQEGIFDGTGDNSAAFTSLTWLSYDPATSLTSIGSAVDLLSGGIIANVTEVGYYGHTNGGTNALRVNTIDITAIAVPEPGSAALALTALGGLLAYRRRR